MKFIDSENIKKNEFLVEIFYDTDPGNVIEIIEKLLKFLDVKYEKIEEDEEPCIQLLVKKS